jgi:hypothetical protein
VELVDAPDSKSGSERSVGSIPTARTRILFGNGCQQLKKPHISGTSKAVTDCQ